MRRIRRIVGLSALVWLSATPVLKSQNLAYTEEEIRMILRILKEARQLTSEEQLERVMDAFLASLAMQEEARRLKLDQTLRFRATQILNQWEYFQREIIRREFERWFQPSDEELKKVYEENLHQFVLPERAHYRQIVLQTKEEAEAVVQELEAGKDFSELAKLYSTEARAKITGGDRGMVPRNRMHPKVADVVFSLEPGEYNKTPLQLGGAFYVFSLVEKHPAETLSFESARDRVVNILRNTRWREFRETYLKEQVEEWKKEYQVEGDLERLREIFLNLKEENGEEIVLPAEPKPGIFLP